MTQGLEGKKFEELLEELEGVVRALQEGSIPLEEALALYEKGCTMVKSAQERLVLARQKLEVLRKDTGGDEEATD